jgi:hypothetical protein
MIWCGSVWDWVPGWGCYVSASITDPTCEGESLSLSLFPLPSLLLSVCKTVRAANETDRRHLLL